MKENKIPDYFAIRNKILSFVKVKDSSRSRVSRKRGARVAPATAFGNLRNDHSIKNIIPHRL